MNTLTRKLYVAIVAVVIIVTMSGCGWLDKAINAGLDKGFGNGGTCSGIVC
jgi:hypothetical protein